MGSNIAKIKNFGQSIWLDNLSRELLYSDQLKQLIINDGISSVTSNPSIFHKAIANDKRYQEQLDKLNAQNLTLDERYEKLAIEDIQEACKLMNNLYYSTKGQEGYV